MNTISTGEDGLKYLQSVLHAGDSLGLALADLPIAAGSVYTFLPDNVPFDAVSLEYGGLSRFPYTESLRSPVVQLVGDYLQTAPGGAICVEVGSREADDAAGWIARIGLGRHFVSASRDRSSVSVYGVVAAAGAEPDQVSSLLDEAWPFRTVAAVTSRLPDALSVSGATATPDISGNSRN